jgi:hypothetical protein
MFLTLMHVLIYKPPSHAPVTPKFPHLEKRYSDSQLKKFHPNLRHLLSFSHKTVGDLKEYLSENDREDEMRYCEPCKRDKPSSMSH